MIKLSVVVPTFNESANVRRLLALLEEALVGTAYEVIFVDDDSPDGTAELLRSIARTQPHVRVLRRVGRSGLSSACLEGMLASSAPYIAVMDADLQHDERILPAMLRKLEEERLDVVVGSRNIEGGSMGNFAKQRVALSTLGRKISNAVCRCPVNDPMSGYFVLDRRFLSEVVYDISAIGFKILVDLLASARRPVRIGEVPYSFRDRSAGDSKLDSLVLVEYLQLVVDKLLGSIVPPRFLLFAAVGALGVLVHLSLLILLCQWGGLDYPIAFGISTLSAMISNYFLNNAITYRDCRLKGWSLLSGLLSFMAACSIGALISWTTANQLRAQGSHWIVASLNGIVIASVWNYSMTQMFTWRLMRRARRRRALNSRNANWEDSLALFSKAQL